MVFPSKEFRRLGAMLGYSEFRDAARAAQPHRDTMSTSVQETTFVDNYLPALLAQASLLISAEFHRVVLSNGLSISEWRILSTLSGAGEVSIGHLARIATIKQPTVTRLLDRLEKQGLLQRVTHDQDRRVTLVCISEEGQTLIAGLIVKARLHEEEVIKRLQPLDADDLKATLRRLISEQHDYNDH